MECDLAGEYEARESYAESKRIFEDLIQDEEGHIDFLETQLELKKRIGEQKYQFLCVKVFRKRQEPIAVFFGYNNPT